MKPAKDEKRYDIYFAVIIYVPYFSFEAADSVSARVVDIAAIDVDMESLSVKRKTRLTRGDNVPPLKRRKSADSEATTEIESRLLPPVVELRDVSCRFYWRE